MKNIVTSEFSVEIENSIVEILKSDLPQNKKVMPICKLGLDFFESQYYCSQAENVKNGNTLVRAQLNLDTFQSIFPKF